MQSFFQFLTAEPQRFKLFFICFAVAFLASLKLATSYFFEFHPAAQNPDKTDPKSDNPYHRYFNSANPPVEYTDAIASIKDALRSSKWSVAALATSIVYSMFVLRHDMFTHINRTSFFEIAVALLSYPGFFVVLWARLELQRRLEKLSKPISLNAQTFEYRYALGKNAVLLSLSCEAPIDWDQHRDTFFVWTNEQFREHHKRKAELLEKYLVDADQNQYDFAMNVLKTTKNDLDDLLVPYISEFNWKSGIPVFRYDVRRQIVHPATEQQNIPAPNHNHGIYGGDTIE